MATEKVSRTSTPAVELEFSSMSIKDFATLEGFSKINPLVRVNTNGYPFVTFLKKERDSNGKTIAENVYFSIAAAEKVSEGESIKAFAAELRVTEVENADGEMRWKIHFDGGEYESIDSLY